MVELTKEFLELEGVIARKSLLDAIQSDQSNPGCERRTFNFNLFDVEIDYVSGSVTVEDAISPCRDELVPLAAFLDVLRSV
nr:putative integron gene cassette protein [uncultured bacterium]